MITVACVLRSGGDFTPEHVWALRRQINKHLSIPHEFRVLTDCDFAGPLGIRLVGTNPGWWAKLELFRPGLFSDTVLYFDLDTVLVGSIDAIAGYAGEFALLSDFYTPHKGQSGVMIWRPNETTARIWERFAARVDYNMRMFPGDAPFIYANAEPYPDRLQDVYPGQIVSYKRDCALDYGTFGHAGQYRIPDGARVVCFHGQPRPWTTPLWEMEQ